MVIHKILRENGDNLKIFHKSSSHFGLAAQIDKTISELQQCVDNPEQLNQYFQRLHRNTLTSLKFSDLNLIFAQSFEIYRWKIC